MNDYPMPGGALIDVSPRDLAIWRIVAADGADPMPRRRAWMLPLGVFVLGLTTTAGLGRVAWQRMQPDTIISTRIVVDGSGDVAGRAALSDVALRLATAPDRPVALEDNGATLVVTARDPDPAQARQRVRTLVDAILNVPPTAAPAIATVAQPDAVDSVRGERARLVTAIDAADARATAISTTLAGLARDAVAANRAAADRRPGRDTLDKGNAALADLQLQRLQLVNKYQDTYPAVLAMDAQIQTMRGFLAEQARRVETHPPQPDAGDATLSAERDRLLAEMAQLGDRRRDLAAELAALDQKLTTLPSATPTAAPAAVVTPMLVAASTTSSAAEDLRLVRVPLIAAAGLALSALAGFLPRRRRAPFLPHGLLLEQVSARALPPANPYALGHSREPGVLVHRVRE